MNILRRLLDFIYFASGALAAVSLVAILLLIVVQMIARWTGEVFPGAASYAGYAMAAASFLAFANALNRGAHIRVRLSPCPALPDAVFLDPICGRIRKTLRIMREQFRKRIEVAEHRLHHFQISPLWRPDLRAVVLDDDG